MRGHQTTAFTLTNWRAGQQVAGSYCGISYTGRISEGRNTPDYRNWILEVDLDQPITVYGSDRIRLSIWTNAETNTCEAACSDCPMIQWNKVEPRS